MSQREMDRTPAPVARRPPEINIVGHESFTGAKWRSGRRKYGLDVRGKRIAVVENGCSAAQFVPWLV